MLVEYIVPNGVGTAREPAYALPPGTVWQTAQLPIAASAAPFTTKPALTVDALTGSMGSICGFHTSKAPAITTTATTTNSAVINLRPLIGRSRARPVSPVVV